MLIKRDNFLGEVFDLCLGLALLSLWSSWSTGSMGCSETAFTQNASSCYRNFDTPCGLNRFLKCLLWFLTVEDTHAWEPSVFSLMSTTPTVICMHWILLFFFSPSDYFWTMKSLRTKRKERFPLLVRELLQYRLGLLQQHAYIYNSRYKDSPEPFSITSSLWDFTNALG